MTTNTPEKKKTPSEIVNDFLTSKGYALQVMMQPQKIRRMDDGGFVIDAPVTQINVVEKEVKEKEAPNHIETA